MRLTEASPRSGSSWTNTGEIRERVPLKHRADGEVRRVPIHPELVQILRAHIDEFGPTDPDGRLFVGAHAGPVTDRTYLRVFHRARAKAFTPAEAASPLMTVPYALRHAAVSTWLRTTGDAALVARWAGHSVAVLLKVYAKTVDGSRAGVPRPHLERDTPNARITRLQGRYRDGPAVCHRFQPIPAGHRAPDTKGRTP